MFTNMLNPVSATEILDSIVSFLAIELSSVSWNKSKNPHENDLTVRHKFEHWVSYTGSVFNDSIQNLDEFGNPNLFQIREMEFRSYVRVIDLKNDHKPALRLHESIMNLLNGFIPKVTLEGIKSPLMLKSDTLMSPRGSETTFRYEASYKIEVYTETTETNDGIINVDSVLANIYKSDIDYVAVPEHSVLDSAFVVKPKD